MSMRLPVTLPALLLLACAAFPARKWMGIKRPTDTAAAPDTLPRKAVPTRPKADTAWLSHAVRHIPAGSPGAYLGMLEGVRCFNCTPGVVELNLGDSLSRQAGILTLRVGIWNAIERPVRDRRLFDFENRCFFFGYKAVDTVSVGGEQAVIRLKELPCYPYLQRRPVAAASSPMAVPPPPSSPPAPAAPEARPDAP